MSARTLGQLWELLGSKDPSLTYKPLKLGQISDLWAPHSCTHCGGIVIDSDDFAEKPLVNLGEGRHFRKTSFLLRLDYKLDQAIAASREGCLLYEWFLDTVSADFYAPSSADFVFHRLDFILAFETDGKIDCGPVVDAVSEEGAIVRLVNKSVSGEPWSRLSISAHRGQFNRVNAMPMSTKDT